MNDKNHELDPRLEAMVRDELRRTIVPPSAPEYLRQRIERMSMDTRPATPNPNRWWRSRRLSGGIAVAAAIAILAGGLAWRMNSSAPGTAPLFTSPPLPTLSGTPGPTFRPAGDPTSMSNSNLIAWIGGLTAAVRSEEPGADGVMRITRDGGLTWSAPLANRYGLDFLDSTHGWAYDLEATATGYRVKVNTTSDGAVTWRSSVVTEVASQNTMVDSHFSDASHGLALVWQSTSVVNRKAQECTLYDTVDGGLTWTPSRESPCPGKDLVGPFFWGDSEVGLLGSPAGPEVSTTTDGGRTWRAGVLPGVGSDRRPDPLLVVLDGPNRVRLLAALMPTASSWTGYPLVVVYETRDGGATWTASYVVESPSGGKLQKFGAHPLFSINAITSDHWVALQAYGVPSSGRDTRLVETRDSGRTWSLVPSTGFISADYMGWWDERHAILSGRNVDCNGTCHGGSSSTVFVTDDGGRTWHQVPF